MVMKYHYTIGSKIPLIQADGYLRGVSSVLAPREKEVVWFSRNTLWEPTATKLMVNFQTGDCRSATKEEMFEMGLYRFGTDTKLLPFRQLYKKAHIPFELVRALIKVGKDQGADPNLWCGSITPVSIARLILEEYIDDEWQPVK